MKAQLSRESAISLKPSACALIGSSSSVRCQHAALSASFCRREGGDGVGSRSEAEGWGQPQSASCSGKFVSCVNCNKSVFARKTTILHAVRLSGCQSLALSVRLSLALSLSLLTHGQGTIYEAFPSETHCKIYFRFIYAHNARRNNHTVARRRGSACKSVCVCLGLCG